MMNNKPDAARSLLTPLSASANEATREFAAQLLKAIDGRQEAEQAFREYEERRKTYEAAASERVEEISDIETPDEPPVVTRTSPPVWPGEPVIETLTPGITRSAGPQFEGSLTAIDCSKGVTLRVRLGNGNVQLHSDHPESIEFVSYVSSVSNSITCGPVTAELPVLIVYRKVEDPAYFGEPVRVEFLDKK